MGPLKRCFTFLIKQQVFPRGRGDHKNMSCDRPSDAISGDAATTTGYALWKNKQTRAESFSHFSLGKAWKVADDNNILISPYLITHKLMEIRKLN